MHIHTEPQPLLALHNGSIVARLLHSMSPGFTKICIQDPLHNPICPPLYFLHLLIRLWEFDQSAEALMADQQALGHVRAAAKHL